MRKKLITAIIALSLALCCLIGVTLAYLVDSTGTIENVFNPQNISVDLTETVRTYNMVPGITLDKNPTVAIDTDVACYVFVEITETGSVTIDNVNYTFDEFLTYAVDSGWSILNTVTETANANETYVFYRIVAAGTNTTYKVLDGDKVTVNETVTKKMMDALETAGSDNYPKLTFQAYATQMTKDGTTNFEPAEAWANCGG